MPLSAYMPKDRESHRRNPDSTLFAPSLFSGDYVYVQDCEGKVWAAPDECHMHPKVLGQGRPAVAAGEPTLGAAGELTLGAAGTVLTLNNLSGTFGCSADSLITVVGGLALQGGIVDIRAVAP